jgi:nucleoid-associated protein YgaU
MFYKRPDTELEAASASISDSKQACGDVYATSAFQNAQRKLDEARAAADKKEKGAKDLALEAKALAEQSKDTAIKRGEEARAAAEANLSAARDVLSHAEGMLKDLGEDKGAAPFSSRLTSLRESASKVESQLKGTGCDLLLAEEGSKTLLAGAKKLLADVESYTTSGAETVTVGGATHSVVRGECLWRIAGYPTIYSDPFLWPLIYSANRDHIKDPDLIFPGQVFSIPRDASKADKDKAKHKARTRGAWSLHDGK